MLFSVCVTCTRCMKHCVTWSTVPGLACVVGQDLEPGMELKGTILSVTKSSAWLDVGVKWRHKSGALKPVSGRIHHRDLPAAVSLSSQLVRSASVERVLRKDDAVTAYVSAVFPESNVFYMVLDKEDANPELREMRKREALTKVTK